MRIVSFLVILGLIAGVFILGIVYLMINMIMACLRRRVPCREDINYWEEQYLLIIKTKDYKSLLKLKNYGITQR